MIAHGTTRVVFLVGRWAVKVPRVKWGWRGFLRGSLANLSEQEWSRYEPSPPTCPPNPVLRAAPWGLANVYRRATPYTDDFDRDRDRPLFGIFGDAKAINLGWVDGRLVLLDYDMYCSCWKQCKDHGVYVTPEFELMSRTIDDDTISDVGATLSGLVADWAHDRTLSRREIEAVAAASSVFVRAAAK